MNLFWDEVIARGARIVGVEAYDSTHTDFTDQIKKLVGRYYWVPKDLRDPTFRSNPKMPLIDFDAIFIPDAPKKAGLLIPQLVYNDVNDTYLLGTNLWHSDSLIEMSRRHAQGAIIPDGFFAESASKPVEDFVKAFEEVFDQKPEFIEAVAYDTAMILFRLVNHPNIRFRSSLKNELKKLKDFQGVTALTSLNNDGDAQNKVYLLRIEGERFVELGLY